MMNDDATSVALLWGANNAGVGTECPTVHSATGIMLWCWCYMSQPTCHPNWCDMNKYYLGRYSVSPKPCLNEFQQFLGFVG